MLAAMVPHPAPPPSGSPLPPAPPPPTRRSSSKRTASSSPPLRSSSSSSTAWADSWSTGFSKQPSMPLLPASSLNRRALIDTTGTAQGSQSKGRGWRSPAVTPSDDDEEEDKLSDMDKVEEEWIEQVDDGFLLDNPLSHDVEDIPPTTGRPRFNSLGLSLSDLPPPASAFSSTSTTLAYPSPCTPSVATCGGSSYFPLTFTSPWSNSKEALLPPSPTLIPLSLSSPSPQPAFSPAAPRVEPASSHPLHHAKRLSMTPLSYPSELPSLTPPPPAKMQLRKGSIVDLPEMVPPPTPPLTPLGEAEDLPHVKDLTVGKKEELPHGTGLGEERSARFTKMEAKRQRQHL